MIKYLTRNQLNDELYDKCIEKSIQSRIYAYSWYLDIVTENWDVLVLNDYDAVMPLPWKSKYSIKYIYQPCWTQQLGVFSKDEIPKKLIQEFVNGIPKKFKKIRLQFNSDNNFCDDLEQRINYILPLNKTYVDILSGYNKLRKRKLTFSKLNNHSIHYDYVVGDVISIFKEFYNEKIVVNEKDFFLLEKLTEKLESLDKLMVCSIKDEEKNVISGVLFFKDNNRITYMLSASNSVGKQNESMTFIIDRIINNYQQSEYLMDFEGSMIEGIANFYRSFGAIQEKYSVLNIKFRLI